MADQSGNSAGQLITIDVYTPQVTLSGISFDAGTAFGNTNPLESDMPVSLVRNRKGKIDIIGEYKTNEKGEFYAEGLTTKGKIYVKNAKGEPVAEYDETTGKLFIIKDGYSLSPNPSKGDMPATFDVKDSSGLALLKAFYITDANTDTKTDSENTQYTAKNVEYLAGAHVKDNNQQDEFEFNKIAGDDPNWFGATEVVYKNENLRTAIIDTTGYVYLLDGRMTIRLKNADNGKDPLIYELLFNGNPIGEVFISIKTPAPLDLVPKSTFGATAVDTSKPSLPKYQEVAPYKPFSDVAADSPYYEAINDLKKKGVLDGYIENGKEFFKPNDKITRAEFAKIILKMLCITPREEAYKMPQIFSDVPFEKNLSWFYPFTKEGFLRKLIYGYGAEKDPETGLTPFKPSNNINLAEAAKIVIEALYIQNIINFERPVDPDPWYAPYIKIAQDLKPYLKNTEAVKEAFIITKDEAAAPDKVLTRAEFALIAYRVLKAYSCFDTDKDQNGIPDYLDDDPDKDGLKNADEYKYGTNYLNPDTDGDGLKDGEEIKTYTTDPLDPDTDDDALKDGDEVLTYKTNPKKADTDDGGVPDGLEIIRKSDPLNPADDYVKQNKLLPGVYGILTDCNACPCPATIEYTAQLMPGDIIYAVIINKDKTKIFSKSNEILIEQKNK